MFRSMTAAIVLAAAILLGGVGLTSTAMAQPHGDSGGMGACPVVDRDDNGNETTTYVPHGTKLMGLTCKDGTWERVARTAGGAAKTGGTTRG